MNLLVKQFHLTPFEKNINQKANINWDDIIAYVNDLAKGGVAIADSSDGWVDFPVTPVYVSSTSIDFQSVDYTGIIQKGDKLTIYQSGYKYFYVTGVSYATNTTVTLTGGTSYSVSNAAITISQFSKLNSPQGFPLVFSWTPDFTGFSSKPTTSLAYFSISNGFVYVFFKQNSTGTSNATTFTITGFPVSNPYDDNTTGMRLFTGMDNSANFAPSYGFLQGTTLTLQKTFANNSSWTSSGSKGIYGFSMLYPF